MQRLFISMLTTLICLSTLSAQETTDPSHEIWGKNQKSETSNPFDNSTQSASKTKYKGEAEYGTPIDTPIDGGLSVLLIGGTLYGVRRYKLMRAKKG